LIWKTFTIINRQADLPIGKVGGYVSYMPINRHNRVRRRADCPKGVPNRPWAICFLHYATIFLALNWHKCKILLIACHAKVYELRNERSALLDQRVHQ
jgi:hypothetical protein